MPVVVVVRGGVPSRDRNAYLGLTRFSSLDNNTAPALFWALRLVAPPDRIDHPDDLI